MTASRARRSRSLSAVRSILDRRCPVSPTRRKLLLDLIQLLVCELLDAPLPRTSVTQYEHSGLGDGRRASAYAGDLPYSHELFDATLLFSDDAQQRRPPARIGQGGSIAVVEGGPLDGLPPHHGFRPHRFDPVLEHRQRDLASPPHIAGDSRRAHTLFKRDSELVFSFDEIL